MVFKKEHDGHSKLYKCSSCGEKQFTSKTALAGHMGHCKNRKRVVAENSDPQQDLEPKQFREVAPKEDPQANAVNCEQAEAFSNAQGQGDRNHKPYECSSCGMKFLTKLVLEGHQRRCKQATGRGMKFLITKRPRRLNHHTEQQNQKGRLDALSLSSTEQRGVAGFSEKSSVMKALEQHQLPFKKRLRFLYPEIDSDGRSASAPVADPDKNGRGAPARRSR